MLEIRNGKNEQTLSPCIIFISGNVGVGKTTVIKNLEKRLSKERVKKADLRLNHLVACLLTLILSVRLNNTDRLSPLASLSVFNPRLFIRIYKLWTFMLLMSLAVKYLIKIYIPYLFGRVVLVEGGPVATITEYLNVIKAFNLHSNGGIILRFSYKLLSVCSDTYVVLLQAPKKVLISRWKSRSSFERDKVYLSRSSGYVDFHSDVQPKIVENLQNEKKILNTSTKNPESIATHILHWILRSQNGV
ncbi:hypothetical protein AKJ47_03105 [candidate division MSBL1 archaeon SCGC-AAA261G05]|uniref:Deoxynucleoside kinase domain-containing protein n=1 Tax=candidate division MSBL1 archaeon SCGC-AAA261G05 TaxID=1698276 RepID=A0A133V918_9EURY|nr:hypothetical protein AKJ47_03105 [candidate division MSBL1 archaeon SCGC-AAA261G05]